MLFTFSRVLDSGHSYLDYDMGAVLRIFLNFDLCQRYAGRGPIISRDRRRFAMVSFFGDHFPAIVVVSMLMFMVVLGGVSINEAVRDRRR